MNTRVFFRELNFLGASDFLSKGTISALARLLAEERIAGYGTFKEKSGNQRHFDCHYYH